MRILHVPYSWYPDPAGGTEIYVSTLVKWQRTLGCETAVASPAPAASRYEHEGLPVWRFAVAPSAGLRELYGEGDRVAAASFGSVLDTYAPQVLHLHAFTGAVSVPLAEEAVKRGVPVVFNYHTPTVSCARGTLLRWGTEICDGDLDRQPCVPCTLGGYGVSRPLASVIAQIPVTVSCGIGRSGVAGGIATALRMPELVGVRNEAFRRMMEVSQRIFALCEWTRDLLLRNHVPAEKIALCRQGISWTPLPDTPVRKPQHPLRVAFLGRFDATKGTHLIVQALTENPALPVRLDLFGIRQGGVSNAYAARIQKMIGADGRIRILPALASGEVVPTLAEYDLLAVPSQWLETGPLVVLEAFAAGTPVLGSDLGGIAELVRDGVDGLLVNPAASVPAWAEALRRVCARPGLLTELRAGIRPPRHMRDVAQEMMPLYAQAIGRADTAVCR